MTGTLIILQYSNSVIKTVYNEKTKNLLKSHSEVKNVTLLTLLAADKAFSASMATGTVRIFQVLELLDLLESSREKYIPIKYAV